MKRIGNVHNLTVAGALLFVAGCVVFMGITTAEAYYPYGYSTSTNEISDLGSTRPPDSIIYQPSATIFNTSMVLTGVLILVATYLLVKAHIRLSFLIMLGLFGFGVLGVGLFPGNTVPHPYFAMLTFISAGVSAILSAKVVDGLFKYIAVVLGSVALVALFFAGFFIPYLGDGGTERWIAYPCTLWLAGMGAYLLGSTSDVKVAKSD